MRVLVFGDSHVARMASVSTYEQLVFRGISGLKATDWKKYCDEIDSFDLILVEMGGNDVSNHPRKPDIPKTVGEAFRAIKEFMTFCVEKKIGLVLRVISRDNGRLGCDLLNGRLRKCFRSFFIDCDIDWQYSKDRVHLVEGCYRRFLDFGIKESLFKVNQYQKVHESEQDVITSM